MGLEMKPKVSFIGTGVMGTGMILNIMQAGYPLTIYTRTKKKAQLLLEAGAAWASSPAEAAKDADILISMVGYPRDVEDVYLGSDGVLTTMKGGGIVIDMTTSDPSLAQRIYTEASDKDVFALDAPVSGGDVGAKNGTLAIMVGGDKMAYEKALPIFQAMGKTVCYFGQAGSGQYTKMCNQIAIASNMMGVCEAIAYAEKCGLDAQKVLDVISTGAAGSWSLSNLAPRMLKNDFAPGFFVKHFIKDMKIALDSAAQLKLHLPGLEQAKKLYQQLSDEGCENNGTQALIKYYRGQWQ